MKRTLHSGLLMAFAVLLWAPACQQYSKDYQEKAQNPEFLHAGIRRITDIIRHDIFPPPVASRIYAYSSVAAYEALAPGYPEYQSLAGQLTGLKPVPQPEAGKEYCYPLASVTAMLMVGKQLVFSEENIEQLEEKILDDFKAMNMPPDVYERSMKYGAQVAKHIITWSKSDNYAQTRSAPKFTIDTHEPSRWRPTPPQYADALEPHWGKIRPWVIDSAAQFKSDPPIPFSTQKGSDFYNLAYEVYTIVKNITPEQEATAWYWDDNPFKMEVSGHLMFGKKKIGPGGHWMNIAAHACRKANADMMLSAETYVRTACALADGFIACWYEKFRSNLIRPESYINLYIDADWQPIIQTPPFPEHTSGHSTISAAAAATLTGLFGENFSFTDSTEVEFGIPPRTFNSFAEAAAEVGMSRLYGGIHYRRGNEAGLKCGKEIGNYVLQTVKTRKSGVSSGK
ncbi:MAG: vanadium-dependent haloperoxidase [Thermoanaerobaculia bacterium]|nr:vanadium-dependent haloperoxidase [Thermoanaerobaculia bacterium]